MYYHSDSSEGQGNKSWRNHGYELYKPSESQKKIPHSNESHKNPKRNYSFSTYRDFKKNYLSQKAAAERPSRSRVRESRSAGSKPKMKDEHYFNSPKKEMAEPARKKPMLSKDDVYDLLNQSRAQEMKVAELQNREGKVNNREEMIYPGGKADKWEHKATKAYFAESYGNTKSHPRQGSEKALPRKVYRCKWI